MMGVEVTSSGAVSGGPSDPQEEAPRRGPSALSLGRTQRAPAPALASSLRLPAHLLTTTTTTTTSSSAARRHNGNIAARPPPPRVHSPVHLLDHVTLRNTHRTPAPKSPYHDKPFGLLLLQ